MSAIQDISNYQSSKHLLFGIKMIMDIYLPIPSHANVFGQSLQVLNSQNEKFAYLGGKYLTKNVVKKGGTFKKQFLLVKRKWLLSRITLNPQVR